MIKLTLAGRHSSVRFTRGILSAALQKQQRSHSHGYEDSKNQHVCRSHRRSEAYFTVAALGLPFCFSVVGLNGKDSNNFEAKPQRIRDA